MTSANENKATADTWVVSFDIIKKHVPIFEEWCEEQSESYSIFEVVDPDEWQVQLYYSEPPALEIIQKKIAMLAEIFSFAEPKAKSEKLPAKDWVSEVQKNFHPIQAGHFFIYSSFHDVAPPEDSIPIELDPGMAFGTGTHHTTFGCLEAIDWLRERLAPQSLLDLGCGSGILAIAMAKAWQQPVIASDIDEKAVEIASENIIRNHAEKLVTTITSDGFQDFTLSRQAPYDLIVANILSDPLITLVDDIKKHLVARGIVILSGLVEKEQEEEVLAAYVQAGFTQIHRIQHSYWPTLVMQL